MIDSDGKRHNATIGRAALNLVQYISDPGYLEGDAILRLEQEANSISFNV